MAMTASRVMPGSTELESGGVTSAPRPAQHHHEWLTFVFEDLTTDSARLVLHWEKVAVPLKIQEAK